MNTAFATEMARKVSHATGEESKRFSPSLKLHKIIQNYTFLPISVQTFWLISVNYFELINAQLNEKIIVRYNLKKYFKILIKKCWEKNWNKNLHIRNVAISTKLGEKSFLFVLVVLPKVKLWTWWNKFQFFFIKKFMV